MTVDIRQGDCLEILPTLEAESFHACVTDPPYGLGFMQRVWDCPDNVAFRPETWAAVYRVLKPGAHLLAFGGTRTFHRLVCAIEDAGFEIRDTIMWLYGNGFPKSLDVSKALDRAAGAEREVVGQRDRYRDGYSRQNRGRRPGGGFRCLADGVADITVPVTDAAGGWQGWGTALKPACEPICVARKPLSESTVAANVLRHGAGALNIDASRVATDDDLSGGTYAGTFSHSRNADGSSPKAIGSGDKGRWPANVCHDGSPEVLDAFARFGGAARNDAPHPRGGQGFHNCLGRPDRERFDAHAISGFEDAGGSPSRFFFCGKADASERVGNHPTVKPVALMEWLVRLVTQPGGRVLDPFAGTGSTLVACDRLGFDALGIEQDTQTVADAHEKLRRMRARRMIGDAARAPVPEGQMELGL